MLACIQKVTNPNFVTNFIWLDEKSIHFFVNTFPNGCKNDSNVRKYLEYTLTLTFNLYIFIIFPSSSTF